MAEVSVIVPSYNQAAFISNCINSILTQKKKPHEIIVVDDASTDNTIKALKPYITKIKLIQNKKNLGAFSYTSNVGIKQATGDFIQIISADDWLLPTALKEGAKILDNNPQVAMVYSQAFDVIGGKRVLKMPSPAGKKSYIGRKNDFELLLTKGDFIPSLNALVRRNVYEKVGLFDTNLRYMVDYEMWIRISKSYDLAYIAKPLTCYRIHGKNLHLNSNFHKRNEYELKYILNKYLSGKNLSKPLQNVKREAFYNYFLKLAVNEIFRSNPQKTYQYWKKAIQQNPSALFSWKSMQPGYFYLRESAKKLGFLQ